MGRDLPVAEHLSSVATNVSDGGLAAVCVSACNFDPVSGGIGRPKLTPLLLLCSAARVILTRVVGDADCGDDWPDTARAFMEREID